MASGKGGGGLGKVERLPGSGRQPQHTWRPDGELLTVVMKFDATFGDVMNERGQVGDYTWWLDYAESLGVSFNIRGRRKRKQTCESKSRTVMHITGRQGTTVAFWRDLRKAIGHTRGTMKGLPLADRCILRFIGDEGLCACEVVTAHQEKLAVCAQDAGVGPDEEADSEDEASNPDEEEHMQDPLTRAQILSSAQVGTEVPNAPQGLDTTTAGAVDDTAAEARGLQVLLAKGAMSSLEVGRRPWGVMTPASDKDVRRGISQSSPPTPHMPPLIVTSTMPHWVFFVPDPRRRLWLSPPPPPCQATPFSPDAELGKEWWKAQVQSSVKRGADPEDLGLNGHMVFAITCMGRGRQLLTALAVNLVIAFPFRRCVKFMVMLLGDDDEGTWEAIKKRFQQPLDEGWLVVASGGAAGKARVRESGCVDAPEWMPVLPGFHSPGLLRKGPEELRYWHASWAKNASHQFGLWACGKTAKVLVNLDCDNMMTPEYISGVAAHFRESENIPCLVVVTQNCEEALTGRLAYRPQDFLLLRGYDTEGTEPAACEDVDLRERLLGYSAKLMGYKDKGQQRKHLYGKTVCGSALANDLNDLGKRNDRSTAKLANVDPAQVAKYADKKPEKRFSKMCEVAWAEIFKMRLLQDRFVRNDRGHLEGEPWFCCWWTCLRRPKLAGSEAKGATSNGSGVAEPSDRALVPSTPPPSLSQGSSASPPSLSLRCPPAARRVNVRVFYGGLRYLCRVTSTPATTPHIQLPSLVSPLQVFQPQVLKHWKSLLVFPRSVRPSSPALSSAPQACLRPTPDFRSPLPPPCRPPISVVAHALVCRKKCNGLAKYNFWDAAEVDRAVRQCIDVRQGRLLCVDCRPLYNPVDKAHRCHLGTHPANFGPIVYHQDFTKVVKPAALAMKQAYQQATADGEQLTLVFLCKSGRHRSVACARVAAEVAVIHNPFRFASIMDLTPMSMTSQQCGECAACEFWSKKWDSRNKALAHAVGLWDGCARQGP